MRPFFENLVSRIRNSRMGKSLERFSAAGGSTLAGGISYMAIFSLTAALTVGWTVFSAVLGGNERLRTAVIESINTALPGLLSAPGHSGGLVDPDSLIAAPGNSLIGWGALVVLLFTGSGVISALARSLRAMFGLGKNPEPLPRKFLRRLLGLFLLFGAILLNALLTIVFHGALVQLAPVIVDFLVFIALVRWVAVVPVNKRNLVAGGLIAAAGSTLLRLLGTSVLTNVTGPILTAAAALVTLLLWVNLLARVSLLAAAWAASGEIAPSPEHDPKNETPTTEP